MVRNTCIAIGVALVAWGALAMSASAQPTAAPAAPPGAQAAAPQSPPGEAVDLDALAKLLDQIQRALRDSGHTDETLSELRERLAPIRDGLRAKLDVLDPRLAEVDTRLSQLGAPPPSDAPPESAAVTAERSRLAQTRAEVDGTIKQTKLLALRADELADRINENRRTLFSRVLLARTPGLLDWEFWREPVRSLPAEAEGVHALLQSWWSYARANGGPTGGIFALLTLAAAIIIAVLIWRWWCRTLSRIPTTSRFTRAVAALMAFGGHAAVMPVVVIVILKVLDGNGLMPVAVASLGLGLAVAVAVASVGRAIAIAVLAPDEPARRLVSATDDEARRMAFHLTWCARVLGAAIFINLVHKSIGAPLAMTVMTSALMAAIVCLLSLYLLLRAPTMAGESDRRLTPPWVRLLAWIFVAAIAVCLVTGFIGLAAFLAGRGVVLVAMAGAYYLCVVFVDALFADVLTGSSERGRRFAAMFGMGPRGLDLIGTLLSAALKILLALLAILPVLGPWGVFAADVFGVIQDAMFGFRIGDITISVGTIIAALALLLVGIVATRAVQRWLDRSFLPRTGLDPGLQNSVSALIGYAGFIAALVFALAELGIDLQKIALIAGALSVGIGFGLQSVVSNFVSGIILLAERAIRVGDWVVVKNEEGFVRRINVRATEIETFDRASVIIPNSDLITGVVKNLTYGNTLGRISVKVGVAYDTDIDQARDILLKLAAENDQVIKAPPPKVLFMAFGDKALELELRCFVSNVSFALDVRSELNFAILRAFRTAGIGVPANPAEVKLAAKAPTGGKPAA